MKNAITYFLLSILFLPIAYAKKGEHPAHVANPPVQFMQNKGQITDQHGAVRRDIDVKIEANGVVMFVGDGELHYQWVAAQSQTPIASGAKVKTQNGVEENNSLNGVFPFRGDRGADSRRTNSEVDIYRMDVKLLVANKNAQVIFEEPTGYYENYYTAHTGENGVRANGYGRVIYKNIYNNIDLVFYTAGDNTLPLSPAGGGGEVRAGGGILAKGIYNGSSPLGEIEGQNSQGIKYDFVIHPGGNPADIKLRYEGATEVRLVNGSLVATTPLGTITEEIPYSYCKETGEEVASAFVWDGTQLSFSTGSYTGTLVIDPFLRWGTYFGGNVADGTMDVHTSYDGYIYMTGWSSSTANMATTGAYRTALAGNEDVFIAKFDDSCRLQWATYYGGHKREYGWGISGDRLGNIYIYAGARTAIRA